MDKETFDDIIRRKVGEYQVPYFDPAHLSMLRKRLQAMQTFPWYVRHNTLFIIGAGLFLFTLINGAIFWHTDQSSMKKLHEKELAVHSLESQLDTLKKQILVLEKHATDKVQQRDSPDLGLYDSNSNAFLSSDQLKVTPTLTSVNMIYLGSSQQLSNVVLRILKQEGLYYKDGDSVYLLTHPEPDIIPHDFTEYHKAPQYTVESVALENNNANATTDTGNPLSSKTARALDKHFHKGIGLHLGPTIDLSKGIYSDGYGKFDVGGGIIADFILSPKWSIETGAKYLHRHHFITKPMQVAQLPHPQQHQLGTLEQVEIDDYLIEFPMAIKYHYPLTQNSDLLLSIGYSTLLYMQQDFEYSYRLNGTDNNGTEVSISNIFSASRFYPGTLNFSWGASKALKNSQSLETSLYYQHGLDQYGREHSDYRFLGLRCIYWFRLK